MKKSVIISIIAVLIIAGVVVLFATGMFGKKEEKTENTTSNTSTETSIESNLGTIETSEDLSKLVDKLYEKEENLLPSLQTQEVDISDDEMVKFITGLDNGKDLEFVVVSEPMMSSQAYSLILAKVKDGVSANDIAKSMHEKVDARKWICVTAEKVYATRLGIKEETNEYEANCNSFASSSMVYFEDFLDYCNAENISFVDNVQNNEWISVEQTGGNVFVNAAEIEDNKVPDVKGMNITDATYLLESMGWKVKFEGYGKVKSQSVKAGTELKKGSVINLVLSAK